MICGRGPRRLGAEAREFGFICNVTTPTTLSVPGTVATVALGVSGPDVVGYYDAPPSSQQSFGFLYDGTTDTTIDAGFATIPLGVSAGDVVGSYDDAIGGRYGFLYNGTTYTTIAVPDALSTNVVGIYGREIVGEY